MLAVALAALLLQPSKAQPENAAVLRARAWLAAEVRNIERHSMAEIRSAADWERRKAGYRRDLAEMLGLEPFPPRTPLAATVVGTERGDGFVVEKLHFQPVPGLYVAANFFRPAKQDRPAPTILYVCGHSQVMDGKRSLGNKAGYAHHGAWFAREGFCCLVLDTVQWGEFLGEHHGTYRLGRWWWQGRGYTPAGLEAWTAIRALDWLETRPEVDRTRFGMTGRSGGGAYAWWTTALDDRIRAAVPVAGITDLRNYVMDRCIEGHCDCMFMVNSARWDFDAVAALAAPRPLLIANSDKDAIFPLDGVVRLHERVRRIYRLLGAERKLGLYVTEGPHEDTQELQVGAFRWLARWLRDQQEPVRTVAANPLPAKSLAVFDTLPADQRDTRIDEDFVPAAAVPPDPHDAAALLAWSAATKQRLLATAFRNWPREELPLDASLDAAIPRHTRWSFASDGMQRCSALIFPARAGTPASVVLRVAETKEWLDRGPIGAGDQTVVLFAPRAEGDDRWEGPPAALTHLRRCYPLVGRTLEDCQAWDVRRAIRFVQSRPEFKDAKLTVAASGRMALVAAAAAAFEPGVAQVELSAPPVSLRDGPQFLGAARVVDAPQLVALLLPRKVALHDADGPEWQWFRDAQKLAR